MKQTLTELLGWYGVIAVVAAYALNNFDVISVDSMSYLLLNATGAIGIAYDAYQAKNYQPVVLNIIWLTIALIGIIQALLQ